MNAIREMVIRKNALNLSRVIPILSPGKTLAKLNECISLNISPSMPIHNPSKLPPAPSRHPSFKDIFLLCLMKKGTTAPNV